jgi:hypothetical protein
VILLFSRLPNLADPISHSRVPRYCCSFREIDRFWLLAIGAALAACRPSLRRAACGALLVLLTMGGWNRSRYVTGHRDRSAGASRTPLPPPSPDYGTDGFLSLSLWTRTRCSDLGAIIRGLLGCDRIKTRAMSMSRSTLWFSVGQMIWTLVEA